MNRIARDPPACSLTNKVNRPNRGPTVYSMTVIAHGWVRVEREVRQSEIGLHLQIFHLAQILDRKNFLRLREL